MELRLAYGPGPDDAFMFFGLAKDKTPTGRFHFVHIIRDIETLNRKALQGEYDATAISFHAYAYVADKYTLLHSGAGLKDRSGPIIASHQALRPQDLSGKKIAIPGIMTSAHLALKLFCHDFEAVVIPFDQIINVVERGAIDAGLLTRENQVIYRQRPLHKIMDLGERWHQLTGFPLPLRGIAVRKELGVETIREISGILRESIYYAFNHREAALDYAMQCARKIDLKTTDSFIASCMNEQTLDCGPEGRRAIQIFLDKAFEARLTPLKIQAEFIE